MTMSLNIDAGTSAAPYREHFRFLHVPLRHEVVATHADIADKANFFHCLLLLLFGFLLISLTF